MGRLVNRQSLSILFMAFFLWASGQPGFCQGASFEIRGRVVDQTQKPVAGVDVALKNSKGEEVGSAKTDQMGEFEISHKECKSLSLVVLPQVKTGLATAFIEGVPGDVTRSFVVPLKHGFAVSGRVIHDGKGLKGLTLKAIADQEKDNPHTVHDGGSTTTLRNGRFKLILTPGRKHLVISNDRYGDLSSKETKELNVTSDLDLGDIILSERN